MVRTSLSKSPIFKSSQSNSFEDRASIDEIYSLQIDGLVQERRNSIANAVELRLSCINPLKWVAENYVFLALTHWNELQRTDYNMAGYEEGTPSDADIGKTFGPLPDRRTGNQMENPSFTGPSKL